MISSILLRWRISRVRLSSWTWSSG